MESLEHWGLFIQSDKNTFIETILYGDPPQN
jgi:hypothetical protein